MAVKWPQLPRYTRDVKLLFAISGLFALSFYGIQILLRVLYIIRLGHGPEYVGLFNASGALTFMVMSLPSGALGARYGTRCMMRVGGVITTLGMVLFPMTEFLPMSLYSVWPIASQVFMTLGWAMLSTNLVPALMVATTVENRSRAYALNGALRGAGTLVGSLFGGALPAVFAGLFSQSLDTPGPYRYALWVGAVLCLAGLIPLSLVRHAGRPPASEGTRPRGSFPLLPVSLLLVYVYLSQGGWATSQAFSNAYMDTELRMPASIIGLITAIGQALAIAAALLVPKLGARKGPGWALMAISTGMAVSILPVAFISHWGAAAVSKVGVLTLSAAWLPCVQIFLMELVEPQWRSLTYGALSSFMGFAYGSVSLGGGYLAAAAGYGPLFLLGVALCTCAALFMWLMFQRRSAGDASVRSTRA